MKIVVKIVKTCAHDVTLIIISDPLTLIIFYIIARHTSGNKQPQRVFVANERTARMHDKTYEKTKTQLRVICSYGGVIGLHDAKQ